MTASVETLDEPSGERDPSFEVIVGTYEEFVLGYKVFEKPATGNGIKKYHLKLAFTNHSHTGSIRCLSRVGKFIASGSTDESIRLINMSTRQEHGYLHEQSGTITCLSHYGSDFLLSGCEDGTICIWKSGSWLCEKTLKAHEGGVIDLSVHPSGKLALSIGKDKTLKTWNLIKGRTGYITNLKGVADAVKWSPAGDYYAVSIDNRVDIYNTSVAKVEYSIPFGRRADIVLFPNEEYVFVAGDKSEIEVHSIKNKKKVNSFTAHTNRVKDMFIHQDAECLVTVSNDGFIKIWSFSSDPTYNTPVKNIGEINTSCRITKTIIWAPEETKEQEEAEASEEENSDDDEDEDMEEEIAMKDDDANEGEVDTDDEEETPQPQSLHRKRKRRKI